MPVTLKDKVDKKIDKLLVQGHTEKIQECLNQFFVKKQACIETSH